MYEGFSKNCISLCKWKIPLFLCEDCERNREKCFHRQPGWMKNVNLNLSSKVCVFNGLRSNIVICIYDKESYCLFILAVARVGFW